MKNLISNLILVSNNIKSNKSNENGKAIFFLLFITFLLIFADIYAINNSILRGKLITEDGISIDKSSVCVSSKKCKIDLLVDDEGYYYCGKLEPGNYTIIYTSTGIRIEKEIEILENLMHKLNFTLSKSNTTVAEL